MPVVTKSRSSLVRLEALDPQIKVMRQSIVNAWVLWCGIVFVVFLFNTLIGLVIAPLAMGWLILTTMLRFYHMSQIENFQHYRQIEALTNLHALIPVRQPLPPMRLWAASPDLAVIIWAQIKQHQPQIIVELGTGVSTIVAGYAVEPYGGQIYSFEHQADFAAVNQARLEQHQLSDYVTVIHAPLHDGWYTLDQLRTIQPIDMLIVDGPPGVDIPQARYPALPNLVNQLAKHAIIIVDDYLRDYDTVQQWITEFSLEIVEEHINEKGTVVLRKRAG